MQKTDDLHGNAPDESGAALLVIDMINAFDFEGAAAMLPRALSAAQAIAALKRRTRAAGMPVVYVNDNFGRWRSDFRSLLAHVTEPGCPGKSIAELLRPESDDYFVLKPKHSGFQFTSLDVLLEHLGARTLILTGVAGNFCVLFTAQDAYMRDYRLAVPRDCIASQSEDDDAYALEHMAKVTKADTRPSAALDLAALAR
ncbi:MAG TPA: isochorismatase family cysteine hydrolase [Burkholderiales bacterium]|nr:isochorismatase family cysteine hydrolase [Burkholderiales bacterium]